MALGLREGSGADELRGKEGGNNAAEDQVRAASCYASSESFAYEGTPPAAQQMMDRHPPVVLGADHDEGRIPASVFERDTSDPGKDWSMMSTESVFGLQVAPSCDFTGYFLAHPELMDIATPPRDSSVGAATPHAASTPRAPFESIPELGDAAPSYSFAFPKLMEDKGYSSKKNQSREQPLTPKAAAPTETTTTETETETAQPEAEAETSSKPEAAPEQAAAKGGLFSWMPCCS